MPVIIDYILKLSICLAVVYLFYQLFLRRLTFYNWNRWYLLGYSVLSFVIPLIDVMPELQKKELDRNALVQLIPVFGFAADGQQVSLLESLSAWDWILIAGGIGSLVLLFRFSIMYHSFLRIKRRAQLISDDRTRIYQLDEDVRPFSFGNAIFVNTELHSGEELEEIIRHEFVHVRQKHTIDIIWSELLCILFWFNPFVWLLRKSLKQNLEFLADKQVLQNGMDKKEYQYLLLKVMGNKQFAFANHFNFSSLKNRIAMMNSIKSARVHLTKFLFLLPVVAVLLLAFRKEVIQNEESPLPEVSAHEKASGDIFEKARKMAGSSPKPVWFIDGAAVVLGAGGGASLDRDDVNGPDDFKIWADNKIMTMDEANKRIDRFRILSVGASPKSASFENFGVRSNLLLMATNKKMEDLMHQKINGKGRDTVPQKPMVKLRMYTPGGTNGDVMIQLRDPDRKPLLVVDGVQKQDQEWKAISPNDIESVSVLKNEQATSLYGDEGKNGVVLIVTKNSGHAKVDSVKTRNTVFSGTVNYTYTIDDTEKQTTAHPLKGATAGITMAPVNTLSGQAGSGVSESTATSVHSGQRNVNALFFSENGKEPIYMVDGKLASAARLKELDPNKIQSMSVLKDASAQKIYGETAMNGVVLITTKKEAAVQPLKEVVVVGYGVKKKDAAPVQKQPQQRLQPVEVQGYKKHNQDQKNAPVTWNQVRGADRSASRPVITINGGASVVQTQKHTGAAIQEIQQGSSRPSTAVKTGNVIYQIRMTASEKTIAKNETPERANLELRYSVNAKEENSARSHGSGRSAVQHTVRDTIRVYDKLDLTPYF